MSTYRYQQGLGSVGAFQVSGRPYITGSVVQAAAGNGAEEVHISFPSVVKSMTFACTGAAGTACRFHFDSIKDSANVGGQHGPGTHFLAVYATTADVNHVQTIHGKFTDLYVSNVSGVQTGFILYAELTSIPVSEMYELTGSGINEGI
tara:strand:- start:502 stop:945 length:444 start_codon:yes stop_codon:yes gene_type:complete